MRVALVIASLALSACARDPMEYFCPNVIKGDLVVTEIRGEQTADDLFPWIELYNASGAPVDLYGTRIRFRRLDGSSEVPIIVRRSVILVPTEYTVLGMDDDDTRESYVMYGFASDFQSGWLSSAAVDVESCGTLIDRAIYPSLPRAGTYSLGQVDLVTGSPIDPETGEPFLPSTDGNDLPTSWCPNATKVGDIYPGTPNEPNPPCPKPKP